MNHNMTWVSELKSFSFQWVKCPQLIFSNRLGITPMKSKELISWKFFDAFNLNKKFYRIIKTR